MLKSDEFEGEIDSDNKGRTGMEPATEVRARRVCCEWSSGSSDSGPTGNGHCLKRAGSLAAGFIRAACL